MIGLTQLAYKVAPDGHRDATSGGLVGTLPATGTVGTSQLRNSYDTIHSPTIVPNVNPDQRGRRGTFFNILCRQP